MTSNHDCISSKMVLLIYPKPGEPLALKQPSNSQPRSVFVIPQYGILEQQFCPRTRFIVPQFIGTLRIEIVDQIFSNKSQLLHGQRAVVVLRAKSYQNSSGLAVDFTHSPNFPIPLFHISLINTDCIVPAERARQVAHPWQVLGPAKTLPTAPLLPVTNLDKAARNEPGEPGELASRIPSSAALHPHHKQALPRWQ
jgi:hypothetical protein